MWPLRDRFGPTCGRVSNAPFAKRRSRYYTNWCVRGVAQPGSALEWGSSGRSFKSTRPDQRGPAVEMPLALWLARGTSGSGLAAQATRCRAFSLETRYGRPAHAEPPSPTAANGDSSIAVRLLSRHNEKPAPKWFALRRGFVLSYSCLGAHITWATSQGAYHTAGSLRSQPYYSTFWGCQHNQIW